MTRTASLPFRLGLTWAFTLLATGRALAEPASAMSGERTLGLVAGAFLAVFCAIGIYLLYSGLRNRRLARAAEIWPVTGGTILSSSVEERKARNRKTTIYYYTPLIRYAYSVAGADHESGVIRFGDMVRNSRKLADALVAKYPAGATVAVRYDPQDPTRAALETESAGGRQMLAGAMFIGVPLFIAAIGVVLLSGSAGRADLPPEVVEQIDTSP